MKRIPMLSLEDGKKRDSSCVVSAGFDANVGIMEVEYRTVRAGMLARHALYRFVTEPSVDMGKVWRGLCRATSKGQYMWRMRREGLVGVKVKEWFV